MKSNIIILMLTFFLMILYNMHYPPILNDISILIFILYSYYFFKNKIELFFYNIIMYVFIFSNIIGCYLIEKVPNVYLNELNLFTSYNGSTIKLVFIHILFLEGVKKGFKLNKKITLLQEYRKKRNIYILYKIIYIIFLILFVYLLIEVVKDGTSLSKHLNKFQYQQRLMNRFEIKISNLMWSFPVILGFFSRKKINKFLFVTLLFYFICIGQKFGALIYCFYYYYCYFFEKYKKKNIITLIVVSLIFFLVIIVQYTNNYEFDNYLLSMYHLFGRIMQQGQLWWSIHNKIELLESFHISDITFELKNMLFLSNDNLLKTGTYKMMFLLGDYKIITGAINRGIRYAFSTQSVILYYLNYFFLIIFQVGAGIAYGKLLYLIKINRNNLLTLILLLRVFLYFIQFNIQGDFYKIISLNSLCLYILIYLVNRFEKSGI